MPQPPLLALTNATIFTGKALINGHSLLTQGAMVVDLVPNDHVPAVAEVHSYAERILVPGFIDCQVNGGGNVLLNDNPTAERVLTLARAHHQAGTACLVPTCITAPIEVMRAALASVRAARKVDQGILGIHFEGPHIAPTPKARGCHDVSFMRPISEPEWDLYRPEPGEVVIVTLAPECVPPEDVARLVSQGAIVSIGHTEATPEQVHAALAAGARGFTHIYNAMKPIESGREPGVVGTALDRTESWCGLVGDGFHVASPMIRIAVRAKPAKIYLISDAMAPVGAADPKPFLLGSETITPMGGRCVNAEGRLAGSNASLAQVVGNCIRHAGLDVGEVLRMASTYPAAFLGLDLELGYLLPGYRACYSVLETDFRGCGTCF